MGRGRTVCRTKGCAETTSTGLCTGCAAQREAERGSRHARGYGAEHYRIRADLLHHLMPGTPCPRCGLGMWAEQALDAGHSVDLRTNPHAKADRLEHSACNRAWRKGMSMDMDEV